MTWKRPLSLKLPLPTPCDLPKSLSVSFLETFHSIATYLAFRSILDPALRPDVVPAQAQLVVERAVRRLLTAASLAV